MKIAVLADIHANVAALEAVLVEVRREQIDQLVLLGDMVGYYYEPRAVIAALAGFDCIAIRGNHDRMAIEAREDDSVRSDYRRRYGSGLEAVFEQFGPEEWDWLACLPERREITLGEQKILLAHGAPFDPDAYIYPDANAARLARVGEGFDGDAIWLGHTHWPLVNPGRPTILNPGSVGQPRDIGGLASWAIFHTDTGVVALRRTEFAVDATMAQSRQRDPALPRLGEVLVRGRLTPIRMECAA